MVNRDKFTEQKIFIRRFKRRKKDPCIQILKEGERGRERDTEREKDWREERENLLGGCKRSLGFALLERED